MESRCLAGDSHSGGVEVKIEVSQRGCHSELSTEAKRRQA